MRGMKDKYYTTKHIAEQTGIHVNTVRFYESIGFLTPPERDKNGYRMFTTLHVDECKLIRTAMHAEVLQNGLRKKCIEIVKLCAELDFENALNSANEYYEMIQNEIILAKNAVEYVQKISNSTSCDNCNSYKRKETAQLLNVTVDALRNWEMNGLIKIKRSENGYRYYTETDIRRLKIIRALRCAHFSLSSILRLLNKMDSSTNVDVEESLNNPDEGESIVSVCDHLIDVLEETKSDAVQLKAQISAMIKKYTLQ